MSDLPADTLTRTIAEVLADWLCREKHGMISAGSCPHCQSRAEHVGTPAVVSVLATHNEHTAADAWEMCCAAVVEAMNIADVGRSMEPGSWKRGARRVRAQIRADVIDAPNPYRLAAVSPTPPTHKEAARD